MTQSIVLLLIAISFAALACLAAAAIEMLRGRRQSALQWVVLALLLVASLLPMLRQPL